MEANLKELLTLATSTPGRRILALRKVRVEALAMGLFHIVEVIDEAIAHDMHARGLDMRWLGIRTSRSVHAPEMGDIDNRADVLLTGVRDGARLYALGADGHTMAEVDSFLAEVFPAGVGAVTSLPYVEESAEIERVLTILQGPMAATVARFGLTRLVERLARVSVEYREALHPDDTLEFATVREARDRGQLYYLQVVALIIGTFPFDTPEHVSARRRLLGPILQQDAAVRAYRRNKRAVPDMDPATGELDALSDAAPGADHDEHASGQDDAEPATA